MRIIFVCTHAFNETIILNVGLNDIDLSVTQEKSMDF